MPGAEGGFDKPWYSLRPDDPGIIKSSLKIKKYKGNAAQRMG